MLIQTDIYQMPEFNKNMGWITKIMGAFYMVFAIFCESNYFKIKIEKVPTMFMLRKKGQIISSEGFFFSVTSWVSLLQKLHIQMELNFKEMNIYNFLRYFEWVYYKCSIVPYILQARVKYYTFIFYLLHLPQFTWYLTFCEWWDFLLEIEWN